MDGYAVIAEATQGATPYAPRPLDVIGEVRAGAVFDGSISGRQAVKITTGAPVPAGADAVLMVEHTEDGKATQPISRGKNVAPVGEDINAGDTLIEAGRLLRPQDVGVLASTGVADVLVVKQPRVRIVITGDELLPPGSTPHGAQIVDCNSLVLDGLCRRDGAGVVDIVRLVDDRDAIRQAMAAECDVLLISGGSSVGPEDHAPLLLAELGEVVVHGVTMRPSSPAGFGFIAERAAFLLPGNPVSCMCAYEFFAGPAIRVRGGRPFDWPHPTIELPLADKIASVLGRTDFMRVRIEDGQVVPLMTSGASILSSTTKADGVVIIDESREGYAPGERVRVRLWS